MDERTKDYYRAIGCSEKEIARRERDEKIDAAYYRHKAETLDEPCMWSTEEWTAIYKDAGMTDEEIAAYRAEQSQYNGTCDLDFMIP